MAFRIFAGVFAALGACWGFGWILPQNTHDAIGMVALTLLALIVSTVPVGPVA